MRNWPIALTAGVALIATSGPTGAQAPDAAGRSADQVVSATAELKNAKGTAVGRAEFREATSGVLARVRLTAAPQGEHALHVHEVGRCDPPTFESAGGHFNPQKTQHGVLSPKGAHAGDLPNVHVPASGQLDIEIFVAGVTLKSGASSLLDADGSALVMHAKPDDYRSDPAGEAGDRIACGMIQRAK